MEGGSPDILNDVRHHVREAGSEDDATGEARQAGDQRPRALRPHPSPVGRHNVAAPLVTTCARFNRRRGR